jgi:hypothetical protein
MPCWKSAREERAKHEAPDRLPCGVAVRLRGALAERRVVRAFDEVAREHAPRREAVVHACDDDLIVVGVDAAEGIGGLRFFCVVELGEEHRLDLVERLLRVVAAADRRDHRLEHGQALEIVLDGLVDAGVLHFDGDGLAAARDGAMHLTDAGRGEGLGLPCAEHAFGRRA